MYQRLIMASLLLVVTGATAVAQPTEAKKTVVYPQIHGEAGSDGNRIVRVPLDRTGVSDWRFLNPRRPHQVCVGVTADGTCAPEQSPWPDPPEAPKRHALLPPPEEPRSYSEVLLRFENLSSTRTIVVEFADIPGGPGRTVQIDKARAKGLPLVCGDDDKCSAVFHVPSGLAPKDIPVEALYYAYIEGIPKKVAPIQFKVSLFEEETDLSNSIGVFTLLKADRTAERSESPKWATTVSADAGYVPDLSGLVPSCEPNTTCAKDPVITRGNFRDSAYEDHLASTVRVGLTQSLGSRARAETELQVRKGTFGGENASTAVTVSKYRIYLFSANGSIISGGRYTFAAPGSSIAVNEIGEGLTLTWRKAEISHMLKKEVPDDRLRRALLRLEPGDAQLGEGDHHTTILQVRDILFSNGGSVRLNVLALFGQEESNGLDHNYRTVGGELFVGLSRSVSATVSAYRSSREPEELKPGVEPARKGTVWLGTVSHTAFEKPSEPAKPDPPKALPRLKKLRYTLTGYVGWGSGDDAGTAEREDYLGQTASFVPDVIFLGSLAPFISLDETDGRVGKGLSNKLYLSGSYTNHHFSPLRWIADFLEVDDDIASEGTTVRLHHYGFNERVFGRYDAGTELNVEFRVESPRGVKYKTTFAVYHPGKALSSVITKTQFAALGNLSVRF